MSQRIEFGRSRTRRTALGWLLPAALCGLLLAWLACLALCPPATGFHLESGAWLVLWLDLHAAGYWLWRRAFGRRRA